ncbi:MAG: class I SAM-dependent methyltransferase [Candidatus Omnitrophota bacterium]|nr:class I SAM-dependent methyltransferase [Candidatus Omnitrophota bacterium]
MEEVKVKRQHSIPAILFGDSIVPGYVPFYHRLFLLWCKFYRSAKRKVISPFRPAAVSLDNEIPEQERVVVLGDRSEPFINKTFMEMDDDLKREDVKETVVEIKRLEKILGDKGLKFTTPAGTFKEKDRNPRNERTKLWENVWVLANSNVHPKDVILDIGGASTIFTFMLAHKGHEVHVVDNDWGNHGIVYNARYVSGRMGWDMKLYRKDISKKLPFKDGFFDKIFSICVLEHLPSCLRRTMMREINRVLKPGGIAGFTFDYDINRNTPGLDKGIRYALDGRLAADILEPSSLEVYGNNRLVDDCLPETFLGTLFLRKYTG